MRKCKIIVLKRMVNRDLIDEYKTRDLFPCQNFEEGQEFVTDSWGVPPEGFCTSAWGPIRGYIGVVINGGDLMP